MPGELDKIEETEIIEVIDETNDDDDFIKSLEEIDEENDENNEVDDEEAKRIKNKNAEEARKRRELEAKLEKERLEKEAILEKEKLEQEEKKKNEEKVVEVTPQEQVKELIEKYPDIDLGSLDKDENFQEYLDGKWVKGGKTITQIYENYLAYHSRITQKTKEEVEKQYVKKSTPSIKGSSGGNGGNQKGADVFSIDELKSISDKMPFMNPREYAKIEEKYERSIKFHKKN